MTDLTASSRLKRTCNEPTCSHVGDLCALHKILAASPRRAYEKELELYLKAYAKMMNARPLNADARPLNADFHRLNADAIPKIMPLGAFLASKTTPAPKSISAIREQVLLDCWNACTKGFVKYYPWYASADSKTLHNLVNAVAATKGPVVSIGSGWGVLESAVCERMRRGLNHFSTRFNGHEPLVLPEVWCFDPNPTSYLRGCPDLYDLKEPFIPPICPTLPDLKCTNPEAFKYLAEHPNLTLLLPWCDPGVLPGSDPFAYDAYAIDLLKPRRVVVLYEGSGIAGTPCFFRWMQSLHSPWWFSKEEYTPMDKEFLNYTFDEPSTEVLEISKITRVFLQVQTFIRKAPPAT